MPVYSKIEDVPEIVIMLPYKDLTEKFKGYPKKFNTQLMKIRRRLKNRQYREKHRKLVNICTIKELIERNHQLIERNQELIERNQELTGINQELTGINQVLTERVDALLEIDNSLAFNL